MAFSPLRVCRLSERKIDLKSLNYCFLSSMTNRSGIGVSARIARRPITSVKAATSIARYLPIELCSTPGKIFFSKICLTFKIGLRAAAFLAFSAAANLFRSVNI